MTPIWEIQIFKCAFSCNTKLNIIGGSVFDSTVSEERCPEMNFSRYWQPASERNLNGFIMRQFPVGKNKPICITCYALIGKYADKPIKNEL